VSRSTLAEYFRLPSGRSLRTHSHESQSECEKERDGEQCGKCRRERARERTLTYQTSTTPSNTSSLLSLLFSFSLALCLLLEFHSLHDSLCEFRNCTSDAHTFGYRSVEIDRSQTNVNERTNEQIDGLFSLFRASERVPFPTNGTAQYGTVRYDTVRYGTVQGNRKTAARGFRFFRLRKEKLKRDQGTRAWAATRQENCQLFWSRASLASRTSVCDCVATTVMLEMCAGVWRTFSHHDEIRGGGADTYDGTAICCNGGSPLGFVEERVFRDGSMRFKAWRWGVKMAPSFEKKYDYSLFQERI